MQISKHIFREYDIRGVVGEDLSEEFSHLLGRAYASLAKENGKNNIAVGYDCRLSSSAYATALANGIACEGLNVLLTGMGPTPQLYFSIFNGHLGGGIQITGSHNPSNMNGFKVCLGTKTLSGNAIADLRVRMEELQDKAHGGEKGEISELPLRDTYTKELVNRVKDHMGSRQIKVVVDAGNGVGGLVGPQVLRSLGVEVIELYCEPDGNFPNHHPDPTVVDNLSVLRKTVLESGANAGIGWDGDADRIGVVDERGEIIFGDILLVIFARSILQDEPGSTIIGDVKCSSRLFEDVKKHGGNPIMWKTGHSLIKNKLAETGAALAGEMSGHIFFKHRFYGFDDALYSSARLAEILSNSSDSLSALISDLPEVVSTPEIRVECVEELKFQIVKSVKNYFHDYDVDETDGIRITFPERWGLVRASNTQPVLVMRFEASTKELLEEYRKIITTGIEEVKNTITTNVDRQKI